MRYLYLPLDLDLPLEYLDLFFSLENSLTNNASMLCPTMFFYVISSEKKYETTSSKLKLVLLLPMATTRQSHESGKDHNKLIQLSST
jgi:hypothetical protein